LGSHPQERDLCSQAPCAKPFPPCRAACPARVNIQAYVSLISQGRFEEALEVIRRYIPFPAVCGRVCFAPCEEACQRSNFDAPVSIRLLKRLVSDAELPIEKRARAEPVSPKHGEKIVVIGSGPAGLTAAYELVKMGYPVTVFEGDSRPGGMLRSCLPRYRLPEDVLDAEIGYLADSGVEVRTGVTVGRDLRFDDIWGKGYAAILIAVGAARSRRMMIDGEDLEGVFDALEFLRDVNAGAAVDLRGRVAVVGGGNVAVDAARTALRLGADEVVILYRRSREEMPAIAGEVEEAEVEGVKLRFLSSPTAMLGEGGRVRAVECVRMMLGEPDESGRRRPIPIEGSEEAEPFDAVIIAVGEGPDLSFLPEGIGVTRWNAVEVDPVTLQTSVPNVFAGGDAVTGPTSVIDAIASGKHAASAIDLYLRGGDMTLLKEGAIEEKTWATEEDIIVERPRHTPSHLSPDARIGNFREVELGYTRDEGILEAYRCLHCGPCSECLVDEGLCEADRAEVDEGLCSGCGTCVLVCRFNAIHKDENGVARVDEGLCKGCGVCAASCPERAIAMGKPPDASLIRALTAEAVENE